MILPPKIRRIYRIVNRANCSTRRSVSGSLARKLSMHLMQWANMHRQSA